MQQLREQLIAPFFYIVLLVTDFELQYLQSLIVWWQYNQHVNFSISTNPCFVMRYIDW